MITVTFGFDIFVDIKENVFFRSALITDSSIYIMVSHLL